MQWWSAWGDNVEAKAWRLDIGRVLPDTLARTVWQLLADSSLDLAQESPCKVVAKSANRRERDELPIGVLDGDALFWEFDPRNLEEELCELIEVLNLCYCRHCRCCTLCRTSEPRSGVSSHRAAGCNLRTRGS